MFIVDTARNYLYPPAEFNMFKCLVDGVNGKCFSNFQKMSDVQRQAIIRKTITVAIAAGLIGYFLLGTGGVIQVSLITGLLTFAMETCPYGQLNIDLSRLRN